MKTDNPILFVEINESQYIFVASMYDDNQNLKVIEKIITPIKGINKNKFTNIVDASEEIKKNVEVIESKLNFIFKEVTVIIDLFDVSCINISGFKKLNGSQLLKENISYILNSLKLEITENEKQRTILHIFNTKSVLDDNKADNLPIGLYGDFYYHELTFFLIKNNVLKNIKQIFNKSSLEVQKVVLKNFSEGTQIINKKNVETFFKIKINKDSSNISFFDDSSYRYSQSFNFGTNIIIKDIEKICSISNETIINYLSTVSLDEKKYSDNDYLEENFFINDNYRKIRKKLITEIANARIDELINIILNKNINLKSFLINNLKIYIVIQDKIIIKNFKEAIKLTLLKYTNFEIIFIDEFELNESILNTANLSLYGWKKEAIPLSQSKKSLITRIFKSLFG